MNGPLDQDRAEQNIPITDNPRRRKRKKNLPSSPPDAAPHTPTMGPILLLDSKENWIAAAQYLPESWQSAVCDPSRVAPGTYLGHSHVVIWGQNDEGGRAWSESVAEIVGAPCHVVLLSAAPVHWQLADGLPPGRTAGQLRGFLEGALPQCAPRAPRATSTALAAVDGDDGLPEEYGARMRPPGEEEVDFIRTPGGGIEKLFANVVILFRQQAGMWDLSYDEFSNRPFLKGDALQDSDMREIASWVQHEGVRVGTSVIQEGILAYSERKKFHPVKAYLESLSWDGKPRLSHLMTGLAGALPDNDGLSDELGRKWMIQAVARIYEPGCQADAMLVLEGEQGLGKSSMFRALFGDRWFTDHLPDLREKDAMLQLRGVWCVEISELATLGRSDSAKIKQFLTSRVDRYRDPYGRLVADWPRTSVFAGTINPGAEGYLKDPTGGRRFWPVPIKGFINIPGIAENRDQLWAEAVAAYRAHEPWHFTDDQAERRAQVAGRQSARLEEDPWEPAVTGYVANKQTATTGEILREALHMSAVADWSRSEQIRVGRILTSLRWERRKTRVGGKMGWVYFRGKDAEQPNEPGLPLEEADVG